MISSGGTRIWGGAKCDSEDANIQKFAKNGLFWPFFSSDGGASGGKQSLRLQGEWPYAPLDAATDDIQPEMQVPPGVKVDIWTQCIGKILGK